MCMVVLIIVGVWVQVAPRLAEAVIDVTENRETRKSIRSLFETGEYCGRGMDWNNVGLFRSSLCLLSSPAQQRRKGRDK